MEENTESTLETQGNNKKIRNKMENLLISFVIAFTIVVVGAVIFIIK
ncbi:MAG: hypothetical protein MR937_02700 [Spirochaetia bacterium]|nr:hypothetical protein [Spirochaetia bacterium]MDD6929878.1 hypothetical protein [Treponema sp.]MDY5763939.1 hypothetical protein [Treponema sp.]